MPNSQIHTASMYTSTWSARFSFCRSPSSTMCVEICRYWISAYGPSPGHWAMPFSWKKRLLSRIDCSKTKLVLMWWPLYLLLFQINRPQAVSNTPIVILLWLCSEWKHPVSVDNLIIWYYLLILQMVGRVSDSTSNWSSIWHVRLLCDRWLKLAAASVLSSNSDSSLLGPHGVACRLKTWYFLASKGSSQFFGSSQENFR